MSEPCIIAVTDCPTCFLGDKRATMLLRFDDKPKTQAELRNALEEALGFPVCKDDHGREMVLGCWAVQPQAPDELGYPDGTMNPLKVCGGPDGEERVCRVLKELPGASMAKKTGGKLLQTLKDGKPHSFLAVSEMPTTGAKVVHFTRSHRGRYHDIAPTLHGQLTGVMELAQTQIPKGEMAGLLCLNYFVEDADVPQGKKFYLFLAVNWFPFKPNILPATCHPALVQREMFSEADALQLQQLFRGNSPVLRAFDRTPVTIAGSRTPHLFLSHNSKDKPAVRRLAQQLNALGIDVWLDEWEMEVGDSLMRSLGAALEKSKHVGLVITPNFLQSQWCLDELEQALAREKRTGGKVVIPMLFDRAVPPPFVEGRLYLNFETNPFRALVQLCGVLYGANPKQVATSLVDKSLSSLDDVRSIVREFGWENFSFIDRSEFKKLEASMARLGLTPIANEVAITAEMAERLKNTGFDVTKITRLIG